MSGRAQGGSRRRDTRRPSRLVVAALLTGLAAPALAARTLYLAENELICDGARILCVDGTLGYDVNDRLLWLRGRVQSTTVAGTLEITVKGTNRLGHVRYAPMEIRLRGHASEIVDFGMIPDYPDVENWEIWTIEYRPGPDRPAQRNP